MKAHTSEISVSQLFGCMFTLSNVPAFHSLKGRHAATRWYRYLRKLFLRCEPGYEKIFPEERIGGSVAW
jgi:hypothetical protein